MKLTVLTIFFALTTCLFQVNAKVKTKENLIVQDQAKANAFLVLKTKCNPCHATENPSKYFTLDNMDGLVTQIKRQVFLWKRMPKGKNNRLTQNEKSILKNWILHR